VDVVSADHFPYGHTGISDVLEQDGESRLAISTTGWTIVVIPIRGERERARPSLPTTTRSSGMLMPLTIECSMMPSATSSEPQTIASGRLFGSLRSSSAAILPPFR